ncbi:MAG: polyprenyl synthetase family protein [Candidatus Marinimicrobia bacterium]|nr:polyprenyl synthetase family protein [Candidatus Neomarinimicrobiota bacterium]
MTSDSFSDDIKDLRHQIDDALKSIVTMSEPAYLYDPVHYVLSGRGKRLRPILVFLVGRLFNVSTLKLMPAALSVELLHNFSLVHDDIMDRDDTRHGQPTVHKKWDESTAILAGDAIFTLVYHQLIQLDSHQQTCMSVVNEATIKLCEGQALDKDYESRKNVTILDYLTMVGLKTGALLSLCCQLGAILGKADEEEILDLKEFGTLMGQAFQIQDDVLEIFSNQTEMGKSLGSDVLAGKKTYLTCKAMEQDPDSWHRLVDSLTDADLHSEVLPSLRTYFEENGIVFEAKSEVYAMMALVKAKLDRFDVPQKEDIIQFVDMITARKK